MCRSFQPGPAGPERDQRKGPPQVGGHCAVPVPREMEVPDAPMQVCVELLGRRSIVTRSNGGARRMAGSPRAVLVAEAMEQAGS